jgi:hypothetical protein
MKKLLLLLLVIVLSNQILAQKNIKVLTKNTELILKGKKEYKYFRLDKTKPTKISVNGPGKLKVIVRIKSNSMDKVSTNLLSIKAIADNKKMILKSVPVLKKSTKFSSNTKWISESKDFIFSVLPDNHIFTFLLNEIETEGDVYVHFSFTPESKVEWEERISINQTEEKVDLISEKNPKGFTYFRIDQENSFKDTVKGRDWIKIIIRPEFKYSEFSDLSVRVALKINGEIVKTYTVNSKRSKVLRYKENGKMIPGTSDKIYYKIPNKNIPISYEIVVIGSKKSALLRVKTSTLKLKLK